MIGQRVKHVRVLDGGANRVPLEVVLADAGDEAAARRGRLRAAVQEAAMEIAALMHSWGVIRRAVLEPNTALKGGDGASNIAQLYNSKRAQSLGKRGGGERGTIQSYLNPECPVSPQQEAMAELGADLGARLMPDRLILQRRLNRGATVSVREKSHDRKLSPVRWDVVPGSVRKRPKALRPFVTSTYVAIQPTCPSSCPLKEDAEGTHGCYVDAGFTRSLSMRLNEAAVGLTAEQVVLEEAWAIDRAFAGQRIPQDGARGGRDLRLHVGGDCGSEVGARALAAAARRYVARGGGSVWTFTHHWRTVPRAAWGAISVIASCETAEDVAAATARGYAVAVVVAQMPYVRKAFDAASFFAGTTEVPKQEALRLLPCPAESTEGVTCASCRLCLDRDLFKLQIGIAFSAHGKDAKKAREQLVQIGAPGPRPAPAPPRAEGLRGYHCGRCGATGHNRATCSEPVKQAAHAGTYHCRGCGGIGHNRRTCPATSAVV